MYDFLKILILYFEKESIPYMLSGSVAMSIYSLPRFTRDFDFVVHLQLKDVDNLLAYFKEGYYCDKDAVKEAIEKKGMFNIIDHKSSYKADFIILKNELFRITEFERKKEIDFLDMKIYLVSPEDLILSKLIWIQEIQSSLQQEDLRILQGINDLDWNYINEWINVLKLDTFRIFDKQ
ncbi:hypothetical protein BH11BAC3_BH11BAC3_40450 [soil metagenome]